MTVPGTSRWAPLVLPEALAQTSAPGHQLRRRHPRSAPLHTSTSHQDELADLQGAHLSARLKRAPIEPGDIAPATERNVASNEAEPSDLLDAKRDARSDFSGDMAARGMRHRPNKERWVNAFYSGEKYMHADGITVLGNAANADPVPLVSKLGDEPRQAVSNIAGSSSAPGGPIDFAAGLFNGPWAFFVAWRSFRQFLSDGKDLKSQRADMSLLDSKIQKNRATGQDTTQLELRRQEINQDQRQTRDKRRESFTSAISALTFGMSESVAIIAKVIGFIEKKSLVFGPAASAAPMFMAGLAMTLVLAPISITFLFGESAFSLRQASRRKRIFEAGLPGARAMVEQYRQAAQDSENSALGAYAKSLEAKLLRREKFFKRDLRSLKVRMLANSLLASGMAVKFGLGVAAVAGGFAMASGVGWAVMGGLMAIGLVATVGSLVVWRGFARSRYESYRQSDDPNIDKAFQLALETIEAKRSDVDSLKNLVSAPAPAHGSSEPSATASRPRSTDEPPLRGPRGLGGEAARSAGGQRMHSGATRPLLASSFDPSANASGGDDDDDDDDDGTGSHHSAPVVAAGGMVSHAMSCRSQMHAGFAQQRHAHQAFTQKAFGTSRVQQRGMKGVLRGLLVRLGGGLRALGGWAQGANAAHARAVYRDHLVRHAPKISAWHYHRAINSGHASWKAFLGAHLAALKSNLTVKAQAREALIDAHRGAAEGQGPSLTADEVKLLEASYTRDEHVMTAINQLEAGLERNAPIDDVNQKFHTLLGFKKADETVSGERVAEDLARFMQKTYGRHNRDLRGMLVELELEAGRVRASVLEGQRGEE